MSTHPSDVGPIRGAILTLATSHSHEQDISASFSTQVHFELDACASRQRLTYLEISVGDDRGNQSRRLGCTSVIHALDRPGSRAAERGNGGSFEGTSDDTHWARGSSRNQGPLDEQTWTNSRSGAGLSLYGKRSGGKQLNRPIMAAL